MKQCDKCFETKPLSEFYVSRTISAGYQNQCKDCTRDRRSRNSDRMFVNGVFIPKSHPLHKPGRYKTLDDAWSHCEIDKRSKEGDVYIIRNMAWTDWYKVGKAVSAEDRLNGYQTSSPFRDYVLVYYETFDNRHRAESEIHRMLEKHKHCLDRKGEWFKTYPDVIKEVMNEYREKTVSSGHRNEQEPQLDLAVCDSGC